MARLTGPDYPYRLVYLRDGRARARGQKATLYTDPDCTVVADVLTLDGQVIPGATVEVDEFSRLPEVQYPEDVEVLYTTVAQGPVIALPASGAERLDMLEAALDGLGNAASRSVGTTAGTVAAGDDTRITGAAQKTANLADIASPSQARTNLGMGNVDNTSDANKPVSAAAQTALNAKAPINNPAFTGVVSGVTKSMVGLGNVDNTSDTNKPVSTAMAAALAGKVAKGELVVNVKDHGAVGDAWYVDQRVTGTWGLPTAVPVNAATYGRGYRDDQPFTIPATDNTAAFQSAWDSVMNAGLFSLYRRDALYGYKSLRRALYIPAGAYYIADAAALFSLTRVSPSGIQSGIEIIGDGIENTILYIRIPNTGATDYLFYDNNWFNGLSIRGVTIVGTTGNERFFYQASTGAAKRWKFYDCHFRDYKDFLTVEGAANADRWVFTTCLWTSSVAGARILNSQVNTQALGFDFHSPAITHHAGGNMFDIGAGGHIRIFGGTTEMYGLAANGAAGKFAYVHGTGVTLGYQLFPVMTVNDHKFEFHDDQGLVDINFNHIVFRDCNAPPIPSPNTRMANGQKHHIVVRNRGGFVWDGGMLGDLHLAVSTDIVGTWNLSMKSAAVIRNAYLEISNFLDTRVGYFTSAGDGLTTNVLTQTGTGSGPGVGRVQVEGCVPITDFYGGGGNPTIVSPNGSPYHSRHWFGRPPRITHLAHRAGSNVALGLPGSDVTATVKVPIGCQLLRVGIVKLVAQSGIGASSRTWSVRDGNGTVLATLATTGTTPNVNALSADLYRVVETTNDATLTLSCDTASTAGTGADGYFFVDYI